MPDTNASPQNANNSIAQHTAQKLNTSACEPPAGVTTCMEVIYTLTLEDHLAWYDFYLTTSEGARLRSSLSFVRRFRRWSFSHQLVSPPSQHALGERTLEVTENGLREFSSAFSFTIPWSEMCLAAVTSSHLFIAHTSMNANIVPLRFFESDAKRESFLSFVKSHVHPKVA
jgi:hypothetical protein